MATCELIIMIIISMSHFNHPFNQFVQKDRFIQEQNLTFFINESLNHFLKNTESFGMTNSYAVPKILTSYKLIGPIMTLMT